VRAPSAVALIHITFATLPTRASLLWAALFHIFPARAMSVMPIMRMDQVRASVGSRARSSRKSEGRARRKSADAPKTPCWQRTGSTSENHLGNYAGY
jgi:hypothetical protein